MSYLKDRSLVEFGLQFLCELHYVFLEAMTLIFNLFIAKSNHYYFLEAMTSIFSILNFKVQVSLFFFGEINQHPSLKSEVIFIGGHFNRRQFPFTIWK